MCYGGFYQFKDEVEEATLYGREATTSQLHQRVMEIAAAQGITLAWGDVEITSDQQLTTVDVSYEQPIPSGPRLLASLAVPG